MGDEGQGVILSSRLAYGGVSSHKAAFSWLCGVGQRQGGLYSHKYCSLALMTESYTTKHTLTSTYGYYCAACTYCTCVREQVRVCMCVHTHENMCERDSEGWEREGVCFCACVWAHVGVISASLSIHELRVSSRDSRVTHITAGSTQFKRWHLHIIIYKLWHQYTVFFC